MGEALEEEEKEGEEGGEEEEDEEAVVEDGENQGDGAAGEGQGANAADASQTKTNNMEITDQVFEELRLGNGMEEEVQESWNTFMRSAESREAAGEAIYAALFDAAPSLQSLFKTPRAVMAMRFMNGLNNIIMNLLDPKASKVIVETLGFQHLDLEVTIPRVVIFRDAIIELLAVELGARLSKKAKEGFCTFLNYVGGSYIYVRVKFADRLKIL